MFPFSSVKLHPSEFITVVHSLLLPFET